MSKVTLTLFGVLALAGSPARADDPDPLGQLVGGLDTETRGPSQAGARDCDKAEADQQKHFEKNMDNPAGAVFGGAKLACSYLQRIAWKTPTAKAAPSAKGKGPTAAQVVATASDFWASADDHNYAKVLSGGSLGGWHETTLADSPDVSYARDADAFHVIVAALANDQTGCFVVYGGLREMNLNHDDVRKPPPSWSAPEWRATTKAEKIPCPKGVKAPTPPEAAPAASPKK